MAKQREIGRLAMRVEGDNWCAYYALQHTMGGALFLGSIRMGAVVSDPARKTAFMDMMKGIVSDILAEKLGDRPTWGDPHRAPEAERSGRA